MNDFTMYDDMLYAIYSATDLESMKSALLMHMQDLIPHDYASILIFDKNAGKAP